MKLHLYAPDGLVGDSFDVEWPYMTPPRKGELIGTDLIKHLCNQPYSPNYNYKVDEICYRYKEEKGIDGLYIWVYLLQDLD